MLITLAFVAMAHTPPAPTNDWPRFRGPNGAGRVDSASLPLKWSTDTNLQWRAELPGSGTSSPIVFEDWVILTAYTGYGLDPRNPGELGDLARHVLAFDRNTGDELWRTSVPAKSSEDPYQGFITQHGYASSSCVTDGEMVFAVLGKSGLFAFDMEGEQVWQLDLGDKSDPARWGDASSPVLVNDLVIVDAGILGNQMLGVDQESGEVVWSIADEKFTNCWATPMTVEVGDSTIILFNVPSRVVAVDADSGETLWEAPSPLDDATCPSVVVDGEIAYIMGSQAGHAMAIDCSADIEDPEDRLLWRRTLRAGIVTPIISGDGLYWGSGGIFYAASMETGEYRYRERLPRLGGPTGGFPNSDYSSPVGVGDLIYQFTRNGESYVIRAGETFDLVSHNAQFDGDDSAFSSTPAIAGDQLFMRSEKYLYCIAASGESAGE